MTKEVRLLRRFRDALLVGNPAGRALVALYYRWSPGLARAIERNAVLRGAARFLLVPIVIGVGIAMGPVPVQAAALGIIAGAILATLLLRPRKDLVFHVDNEAGSV